MTTLLRDFYTEESSTFSEDNKFEFSCRVTLNPEHEVYKGHFEQVPVAPGVCLVQMIKEILAKKFQKDLMLSQGDNIKFLALINPQQQKNFSLSFSVKQIENNLHTTASISSDSTTFVKFKGLFQVL